MSAVNHSRRSFLRGKVQPAIAPLRPPWARPEPDFLQRCTRCGDCAHVCPTKVIELRNGYPQINFDGGSCTFCGDCTSACAAGALHRESGSASWTVLAKVAETCLGQRGVECRVCGDHCDEGAIRFSPRLGGPPIPEIVTDRCTGCGACVAPCPAHAIGVR